jgi:uridine phosphorylase
MSYPILEFDGSGNEALIEPSRVLQPLENMPERCVLCFFQEVIAQSCGNGQSSLLTHLASEVGRNPVYGLSINGQEIAVAHPGVGAPLSAGFLEELIALGARKFIACGGAGVLNSELAVGHVVVPEAAVRDEGTSYHYLPPGREAFAHPDAVTAIVDTLAKHQVPYVVGKTWTTDAVYRETPVKIAQRKAEGCITVEMEAAAFFAVAQFRGVRFGQILYCGDDLGGEIWDQRDWINGQRTTRETLFRLAVEAALQL